MQGVLYRSVIREGYGETVFKSDIAVVDLRGTFTLYDRMDI